MLVEISELYVVQILTNSDEWLRQQHFVKVVETLTEISQNCKFWTYLVIAWNPSNVFT